MLFHSAGKRVHKDTKSFTTKYVSNPGGCWEVIKCLLEQSQPQNGLLVMFLPGLFPTHNQR